ncbi:MAG: hypothetical protein EXS00_00675 [Phycisphaerales bacterium]|nr:hypothetical protein [Phycisphaerales bacterium]
MTVVTTVAASKVGNTQMSGPACSPLRYIGTSLLIHCAVLAALLATGVSVARLQEDDSALGLMRTRLTSTPTPASPEVTAESVTLIEAVPTLTPAEAAVLPVPEPPSANPPARAAITSSLGAISTVVSSKVAPSRFATATSQTARDIAYVIDASGSMVGAFAAVCAELNRSIEALDSNQEFLVVAFQSGRAIVVPPGRLVSAVEGAGETATAWLRDHIICSGGSDPSAALAAAFAAKPEVIFFLGSGAGTSGALDLGAAELCAQLDLLNPRSGGTGRRRTAVHIVECLEMSSDGVLPATARAQGGTYTFLDRNRLGLQPVKGQLP